ncbi:CHASE2 domain-containing protein [Alkalimarinus sediminis]|uniref:histidine kinase n=1 Tax=Alkalimarinus sediminis TaxID=1632866 RepID=A0A9E8HU41_9ALTE|nr:CHASE2 domain-containing protein [Alkalimarinus sediminis]UZW75764.1 CHASE2 domain-containing protein [Alkalimarinus sediminis]
MTRENTLNFRSFEQYVLALVLVVLSGLLIYTQLPERLNLIVYDFAIRLSPQTAEPNTVIVAVDEKSLDALGQWPWRRSTHAKLVEQLTDAKTKAIAFDIIFAEPDFNHPEDDAAFANAIKQNGNVFLPLHIHPQSYETTLSEVIPIPELTAAAKDLGHIHVELGVDGIARGFYLKEGLGEAYWQSMSLALAEFTHSNIAVSLTSPVKNEANLAAFVNVREGYTMIPFAGVAGTFPTLSYIDVLNGDIKPAQLEGKVVLIGATAAGLSDVLPTPVSGLASPMPGVEIHANAYSALVQEATIQPLQQHWLYLLTFAFVLIPVLVLPRLSPEQALPATLCLITGVFLFSLAVLFIDQHWYPPASAIIGLITAYPLWSWQRLSQLNNFLNNELERLHQEPALTVRNLAQRPVKQLVSGLTAMLKPDAYLLLNEQQPVVELQASKLKPPKKLSLNHWFHSNNASWLKFKRDRSTYTVGLHWEDAQEIDKKRAFLHRLKVNDITRNQTHSFRRYEKIASRIAQVRLAIDSMGDMRRFISDGFENMPDGVIVTDSLGIVLFINSHIEQWLKLPKQSVVGQPIFNVLKLAHATPHSELSEQRQRVPDWEAIIQKVLIHGDSSIAEAALGERDLMFHFVPSFASTPGDAGMIINLSDVTSIKQQQRERNELVSFLSHDVRSPLVSQLAILDGIKTGRIAPDNDTFDKIAHHAHRSLHLAEQFLQINRAEQVNDSQFYECDLLTIIENSVDSIAQQASKKQIEMTINGSDELWINGNAELLERVMINLLSNSIKYSNSDTSVTISLVEHDNHAVISIKDQGFGIAQEELPYIFDRFRRQKSSENSGSKGAGLGLNFVNVVIEKHHGSIDVASELGTGTTFTIQLPVNAG